MLLETGAGTVAVPFRPRYRQERPAPSFPARMTRRPPHGPRTGRAPGQSIEPISGVRRHRRERSDTSGDSQRARGLRGTLTDAVGRIRRTISHGPDDSSTTTSHGVKALWDSWTTRSATSNCATVATPVDTNRYRPPAVLTRVRYSHTVSGPSAASTAATRSSPRASRRAPDTVPGTRAGIPRARASPGSCDGSRRRSVHAASRTAVTPPGPGPHAPRTCPRCARPRTPPRTSRSAVSCPRPPGPA